MPSATPRTPAFTRPENGTYEALDPTPENTENSQAGDASVDRKRYGEQYMSLLAAETEQDVITDEDANFDKAQVASGPRWKLRLMMVVAAAALVLAVVKVMQAPGVVQEGVEGASQQKTVAKFTDPCAPHTAAADACTTFNGLFNAFGKACCAPVCEAFCGAVNCQQGPAGPLGCCTQKMTKLCSATQKAPCLLPKALNGAVQLLLDTAGPLNQAHLDAVKAALHALFPTVPLSDIDVAIDARIAAGAGGRRLVNGLANVNYVMRLHPDSPIVPATIAAQSANIGPLLKPSFAAMGTPLLDAALPLPVEIAPSTVKSGATTTRPFAPFTTTVAGAVEPEPELA